MLNSKKKEFLYAASGFGPLLIMVMFMAYIPNAFDPSNLRVDVGFWSFTTFPIVVTGAFAVLFFVGRIFDGLIEIPLAAKIDKMKNPVKRIKLPILISYVPMLIGAVAIGLPIMGNSFESLGNTIWVFGSLLVFFVAYTMSVIAFFGSLTLVCKDRKQRARIAFFKASSDVVVYALAYAVAPMLMRPLNMNIMHIALLALPLTLTILIPVLMIKKDGIVSPLIRKNGEDVQEVVRPSVQVESVATSHDVANAGNNVVPNANSGTAAMTQEKRPNMFKGILRVFRNRAYWPWLAVLAAYYIGLQMFLGSQNALVSGVLQAPAIVSMIINVCAFAPVPLMAWVFSKIMKRKGIRLTFQIALVSFALGVAISFFAGSALFFPNSLGIRIIFGAIGGLFCSFGIAGQMSIIMITPTQVAAVEMKVTGKNNTTTFFAGQGVVMGIFTALTIGAYMLFFVGMRDVGVYTTENLVRHYEHFFRPDGTFSHSIAYYNSTFQIPLGGLLVPAVTTGSAILAIGLAFLMPKSYDVKHMAKYFDKNYIPDAEDIADAEIVEEGVDEKASDLSREEHASAGTDHSTEESTNMGEGIDRPSEEELQTEQS
ncbi:MAG: MFS transporter, partial [Firmicutes bacterium]|nr:MFS transporter [Bacillota bacterium]